MSQQGSRPHPLGVRPAEGGVEAAVLAAHAERVEFCVVRDGVETRHELTDRVHGVWHGFVPGVEVGDHYGYRVHGEWSPRAGRRHNPAKFLLDPYARSVVPPSTISPEVFGHTVDAGLRGNPRIADPRDSMPFAAHGVVTPAEGAQTSSRPMIPWRDTVIYEAHVRGLTQRLPGLDDALRGTYAGIGHPWTIEHLKRLGVTAIELLPVHASTAETHLARRGLSNYWGYSTLNFFAPNPLLAAARDPLEVVEEFRAMVQSLHAAGIEVLLDVVYNHTCESGVDGPTLSFRGLDSATYYRLDGDGQDIDFTGCGNSLDFREFRVIQLTLDSLRYWVTELDVDGFRFDLAPTLARGQNEFFPDHPLLVAMRADPVLGDVKLIAEPWDVGPDGWQTGNFPSPLAEWNDRFRDDVREFWLPGAARAAAGAPSGGLRDLGTRIAGSADTFGSDRGPLASVNFVTAHDGFTLFDAAAYNSKHNLDNGESNRDGTDNNRSWNHGFEGLPASAAVRNARLRSIRNLLGTLLLSAGVPMLVAGDEFGRTQRGNNNAYVQDNEISWVDWDLEPWQESLCSTTRHLISLRREFASVRSASFYTGVEVVDGLKDLAWFGPDGTEMTWQRWEDGSQRTLQVLFADPELLASPSLAGSGACRGSLLLVIAGGGRAGEVLLPKPGWASAYEPLWDSARPDPPVSPRTRQPASLLKTSPTSLRAFRVLS